MKKQMKLLGASKNNPLGVYNLSIRQVFVKYNVTPDQLQDDFNKRNIRSFQVGREVFFSEEQLDNVYSLNEETVGISNILDKIKENLGVVEESE